MKDIIFIKDGTQSITFQVEELERATSIVEEKSISALFECFSEKIEKHSTHKKEHLVAHGYHSFLYSMYRAYSEHRPFVISPDMIWLLISQAFSHHLNFNKEILPKHFPTLNPHQKKKLIVQNDKIVLGDSNSPWEETTSEFTKQIAIYVGDELVNTLIADFSTTSLNEKIASEITLMDAVKPYFEYIVLMCICGIPEITLEGTTQDWEKVLEKLQVLRKYELEEWVDDLEPIIHQIILTSQGDVNKHFWMKMFKIHTHEEYGNPKNIDGWITYFYPYDKDGNTIKLQEQYGLKVEDIFERLPKEIVCVDFKYQVADAFGNIVKEHPMEYWAGFIGAQQNYKSFALRPEIGWFVSHKTQKMEDQTSYKSDHPEGIVYKNLEEIPQNILQGHEKIGELELHFKNEIIISESLINLDIYSLELSGDISEEKIQELKMMFSNKEEFRLKINDQDIINPFD